MRGNGGVKTDLLFALYASVPFEFFFLTMSVIFLLREKSFLYHFLSALLLLLVVFLSHIFILRSLARG